MRPITSVDVNVDNGLGKRGLKALVDPDAAFPRFSTAAASDQADVLRDVLRPGIGISIWHRKLPPAIHDAMAALYALMPLHRLFNLDPDDDAATAVDRALIGFGQLPAIGAMAWRNDLLGLIGLARGLASPASVRVRIETKVNDACRLFHADHVALRMICTYRGPGTQWLPEIAFDRVALGRGNNDHVRDWSAIRELSTGDVAVMKGLRYPNGCADALVHRSPPALPAQPRVVVVIDVLL